MIRKNISRLLLTLLLILPLVLFGCQTNSESTNESTPNESTQTDSTNSNSSDTTEESNGLMKEKPEVAEIETNNKPNRIITTFNGDTKTQMGFNWYTTDKFDDAKVWISKNDNMDDAISFEAEVVEVTNHYAERTTDGYFIFADLKTDEEGNPVEDKNGNPIINGYYTDEEKSGPGWTSGSEVGHIDLIEVKEHSYKAIATGLEPNTTYYYQVGSESGEKSEIGTFKTSGENNDALTFIQYTDTQNAFWNENVRNEAAFGADTLKKALDIASDANFVLHTGDLVEIAEVEDEWVDIFEKSKESWLQLPLAVAPGNHDEYSLNFGEPVTEKFNEHINVPVTNNQINGGSYYSFDYNGVHFVVANTNDYKNPDEKAMSDEQLAWIKEDIRIARENGAKWVILAYHKPLFSKSYHSLQDTDVQNVREEFMQLIDELDVDLALQGHDHVVSRTKSLNFVPTEENFSNATIDEAETIEQDGIEYYKNPQGTVFVLPNTGGTKTYDDVYSKGIEHLHKVRPRLDWMTEEDIEYYNNLFAYGNQPQKTDAFNDSHSNARDSSIQNFAVYKVEGNQLTVEIYQVEGDLLKGEERKVEKVHEFGIIKE